jgi:hypothetical protein
VSSATLATAKPVISIGASHRLAGTTIVLEVIWPANNGLFERELQMESWVTAHSDFLVNPDG